VGYYAQLRGYCEQATDDVQSGCAVSIGQKAIVSDSDKTLGQLVEQKPADKFNGADGGLLSPIVLPIFLPEARTAIFKDCKERVGDSYPVSIMGQVFKHVVSPRNVGSRTLTTHLWL